MNIEINYGSAQEKLFDDLEIALLFASELDGGFHCWVDGDLAIDCAYNYFNGKFETQIF